MNKGSPKEKEIKIQTSCLNRYLKDYMSYNKEVEREQERYEKFKKDGKDQADLSKQQEVIKEAEEMLPIFKKKIIMQNEVVTKLLEEFKKAFPGQKQEQVEETEKVLKSAAKFIEEQLN